MKLDLETAAVQLAQLPQWTLSADRGGCLRREFVFADFVQAFGFMSQVALVAERMNHHPEWHNVYRRVSVHLTTHDVAGLSLRDIELARAMDAIAAQMTMASEGG